MLAWDISAGRLTVEATEPKLTVGEKSSRRDTTARDRSRESRLEGDHRPRSPRLTKVDLSPGMSRQAGIVHARHPGVGLEPGGDDAGRLLLSLQTQRERFHSPQEKEGVEGRESRAAGVLVEGDAPAEILVACHHRARGDVGVSREKLGARVNHQIRAPIERVLEVGGRERVVDGEKASSRVNGVGERGEIRDPLKGIRRGLDEDQPRSPLESPDELVPIPPGVGVDENDAHSLPLDHAGEVTVRAAVQIHGRENDVPGLGQREDGGDGGHSAREGLSPSSVLDARDLALQHAAGGISRPAVVEIARTLDAEAEGRRLVDGGGAGRMGVTRRRLESNPLRLGFQGAPPR